MAALPDPLPIATRGPLAAQLRVPGSKSLTNRALLVAALARGTSQLRGALESDDTRAMQRALAQLGCPIDTRGDVWEVAGRDARLSQPTAPLDTANSGTTARFLTAAATLANGPVEIDGNARMRERPIADLVDALRALGARCEILGRNGCPPVRVAGGGLPGGAARIDAQRSSQYVSAILLAAPYAHHDVDLTASGGVIVSRPYIDLTLQLMRAFGADAEWSAPDALHVRAGRRYQARDYTIEADASAAAYPFCAAAIAGGSVRVDGVAPDSLQPDYRLLGILERMGCRVERGKEHALVEGPRDGLRGVDVDMNDLPDAALALAVVALFARGTTHIRNVANLRIKETDRLAALETELRRLGADARADADSLTLRPGPLRGATIHTYQDHRIAMAFALAGLRIPGVAIQDPGCVAKTWPGYFSMLASLRGA
jgi:3-phosphoshikimate 1-carboxyvinyltransferase